MPVRARGGSSKTARLGNRGITVGSVKVHPKGSGTKKRKAQRGQLLRKAEKERRGY